MTSGVPFASQPDGVRPGTGTGDQAAGNGLLWCAVILIASVLLGLAGGLVWAHLAPRAVYVVTSHGEADVINPETTAFIAADVVYCIIGAAGGLIIGLAGYLLAVRRYGPAPMMAILAGSAAAAVAARWTGESSGVAAFDFKLLNSPLGTHVLAPLSLSGDASAKLLPAATSLPALAFWPLAACVVAGGLLLLRTMRERSAATRYPAPAPGSPQYQGQQQYQGPQQYPGQQQYPGPPPFPGPQQPFGSYPGQ
jgi:hypothetical protein